MVGEAAEATPLRWGHGFEPIAEGPTSVAASKAADGDESCLCLWLSAQRSMEALPRRATQRETVASKQAAQRSRSSSLWMRVSIVGSPHSAQATELWMRAIDGTSMPSSFSTA